jgi:hypothetical protein
MTIQDPSIRDPLLSTALRALNQLDAVIGSDPMLIAQVGY